MKQTFFVFLAIALFAIPVHADSVTLVSPTQIDTDFFGVSAILTFPEGYAGLDIMPYEGPSVFGALPEEIATELLWLGDLFTLPQYGGCMTCASVTVSLLPVQGQYPVTIEAFNPLVSAPEPPTFLLLAIGLIGMATICANAVAARKG